MEVYKMSYAERAAIMEKYRAAWKDAEKISSAAAEAMSAALNEKWDARRAAHKNGEKFEKDPAQEARIDELTAEAARKEKDENRARLAYYISADNAKRALIEGMTRSAVEILNKYAGKPYGEKTREKISAEIADCTGYRAYIKDEYLRSTITFYPGKWTPGPREDLQASYYHAAENSPTPILKDNKIQRTAPETWTPDFCKPYNDNGTPAEIAADVIRLYKEAEAAYNAWNAARSAYNAIRPEKARRIEDRPVNML
jgi:hypothetical protein